jgi:uncharacterized protein involved in cysteine biosynthesis
MPPIPCPVCGYDAPGDSCPHCKLEPAETTLREALSGILTNMRAGLTALPRGLFFLGTTRGVKRYLVPPFVLTLVAFALMFLWVWKWVQRLIDWVPSGDAGDLPLGDGWIRDALEWVVRTGVFMWAAQLGGVLLLAVVGSLVVLWAFSIVYEAIAGPFLDEVQGKIEERWFGVNPRNEISRPTSLPVRQCVLWTLLASLPAPAALGVWYFVDARWSWAVLVLGIPTPFLIAARMNREYGKWLMWVIRVEGGTLWVSLKASAIGALILIFFFPLKFIPGVGYLLFGGVAGFTTAITLLDIPFERRQWNLSMRLRFLFSNAGAMIGFGLVASLLFVIPFIGPVLMVPAASIGGLWLVCALDKNPLRPEGRRLPKRPVPGAQPRG